jgi:hypothetical protein
LFHLEFAHNTSVKKLLSQDISQISKGPILVVVSWGLGPILLALQSLTPQHPLIEAAPLALFLALQKVQDGRFLPRRRRWRRRSGYRRRRRRRRRKRRANFSASFGRRRCRRRRRWFRSLSDVLWSASVV